SVRHLRSNGGRHRGYHSRKHVEPKPLAGRARLGISHLLFLNDQRRNQYTTRTLENRALQEGTRLEVPQQDRWAIQFQSARTQGWGYQRPGNRQRARDFAQTSPRFHDWAGPYQAEVNA